MLRQLRALRTAGEAGAPNSLARLDKGSFAEMPARLDCSTSQFRTRQAGIGFGTTYETGILRSPLRRICCHFPKWSARNFRSPLHSSPVGVSVRAIRRLSENFSGWGKCRTWILRRQRQCPPRAAAGSLSVGRPDLLEGCPEHHGTWGCKVLVGRSAMSGTESSELCFRSS